MKHLDRSTIGSCVNTPVAATIYFVDTILSPPVAPRLDDISTLIVFFSE